MIRTKIKTGNEVVSFWYGDILVAELYDKPGAGQSQIEFRESEAFDAGVDRGELLRAWHQAQCDMWEEDSNAVSDG